MDIGKKIREARMAKGLTQVELGELLGVQKSAIAKYENGRVVNIKRSTLKKISDILGIRPSELIFEGEVQKRPEAIAERHVEMIMDEDFNELFEDFKLLSSSEKQIIKDMARSLAQTKKGSSVASE